jgi:hypothetical protein
MAILTLSGRVAMCAAMANETIHLAWGTGDPAWDEELPPGGVDQSALVNEIGRRLPTLIQFVTPDPDGGISVFDADDSGEETRFSPSPDNAPTNHLYVMTNFDFTDGLGATIRELGVFIGTKTDPELPPGQRYFTPDQIVDPGIMLAFENRPAAVRYQGVRQVYEFVVTV